MNTSLQWFKSTYSGSDGGECLEVAYNWRKSSHSGDEGGECVEVSSHPAAIHIRDSKTPEGPILTLNRTTWSTFTTYAASSTN